MGDFNEGLIFHIVQRTAWEKAKTAGRYEADSLKSEGFIHFSTRRQVLDVANAFYIGQSDLVLLCVDVARLTGELRYEPSADHLQDSLFPHLYGPLNLAAVVSVVLFPAGPDGRFTLPPDIP